MTAPFPGCRRQCLPTGRRVMPARSGQSPPPRARPPAPLPLSPTPITRL